MINEISLSVVISALNEEKSVEKVLTSVLDILDKNMDCELIFLDNHSTDKTGEIADKIAKKNKILKVIHRRNRKNKDLGSSLREGLSQVKKDYFLIMDCDSSHDPKEILNLLKHKDEAEIIIGSRYIKGGGASMNLKRTIISKSYNLFTRILTGVNVKDITTGFKLYNSKILNKVELTNNGFGLHVEISLKSAQKGFTFKEIPIYYSKSASESTLNYKRQFKSYVKPVFNMFFSRFKI